ncbi:uncharacterized protein LOC124341413 [Daphnia pulicaria]|uniref:uncharacterized protein LOC124341413 n=1 Tax=Daphnia pulicaria TaxID=35523 RepID=UPI001EEC00AE|nr:uncharacterized protein LOC124341413 [Daphnia pulicaria]
MECASNVNEDYGAETKLVKKTRYEDESEKYDMPNTRSKSVTRGSCAGNSCTTSSDISPIAGPSGYRLGYSLRSMSGNRNPVASLGESNCEISKEVLGGGTHARILILSLLWVLVGNSLKELHGCIGDGPYYRL